MKKMLITGGTVFVSAFAAQYYRDKYEVYVLNRGTRPQVSGVHHIQADRHQLGDILKNTQFHIVLDITAYNAEDVNCLLDALDIFDDYILISSSAVYPETAGQPFQEETETGENRIWGAYGMGKIAAEHALHTRVPSAYILRPPYLYGPGNNVYRESFVFDCAMQSRVFYLPKDGSMPLQFFHVEDLFRFVDILLEKKPAQRVFNVGNPDTVTIRDWVTMCYDVMGMKLKFHSVPEEVPQRSYFPFYDYAYSLDISAQSAWMPEMKPMTIGLRESLAWYLENPDRVNRKPFFSYIAEYLEQR